MTSDTTEDRTDDKSPPTEDRRDETPGRSWVSLTVSEVGIASELVGVAVTAPLVTPVPNAVVIPTTMPVVGEDDGMSEGSVASLDAGTGLLGTPPADPEGVAVEPSTLDGDGVGRMPVGEANSPVRLEITLDTALEGRTPVGEANSPVRLETMLGKAFEGKMLDRMPEGRMLERMFDGKMPVGAGWSPVRLVKADSTGTLGVAVSLGRRPVGSTPVEPKIPLKRSGTDADCVGCASEDETPAVDPGMMNGPRIVVGRLELGSWVTGDALGGTTDEGMPPFEAPD